jgi:hypothetical protein
MCTLKKKKKKKNQFKNNLTLYDIRFFFFFKTKNKNHPKYTLTNIKFCNSDDVLDLKRQGQKHRKSFP